jgi:DNA modification methylase
MRLRASKDAGLKEVWIDIAEGFTEEQKKEFIVKDNVGFGEWEWDILANEWDSVQLAEWGLDVWENLDDAEPEAGLIEDDEIPEVKESIVKRGDIWQLGEHRVMCGDSTSSDDVAKLMNGEKADMVFTDPPYNVKYEGMSKQWDGLKNDNLSDGQFVEFVEKLFKNTFLHTTDKVGLYVCHADMTQVAFRNAMENVGFKWRATIIWVKNQPAFNMAQYKYKHEPIYYMFKKGKTVNWYGAKNETTVWEVNRAKKNEFHSTQKPVELVVKAISNSSREGYSVMDLCMGGGSTLIAAEKLNRKCYGMELDEKYCDVIINRWEQFTGLKAKKI